MHENVACEQWMLNGGTTVDSIGLMHTRYTLSRCVLGLVVQSGGSQLYGQQSDAIVGSDILGLSSV